MALIEDTVIAHHAVVLVVVDVADHLPKSGTSRVHQQVLAHAIVDANGRLRIWLAAR